MNKKRYAVGYYNESERRDDPEWSDNRCNRLVNYIYDNQHILIQRSVKFFINFVKTYKGDLENDREYNTPIERCNLN